MKTTMNTPLEEAINLTRFRPALQAKFVEVLTDNLRVFRTDDVIEYIDDCNEIFDLRSIFTTVYTIAVRPALEQELHNFGYRTMHVAINGVEFITMPQYGKMTSTNYVKLSLTRLEDIISTIVFNAVNMAIRNVTEPFDDSDRDQICDNVFAKNFAPSVAKSISNVMDIINLICGTFIHELVHGIQHIRQYNVGKNNLMYRSHLSDPKLRTKQGDEFKQLSIRALTNPGIRNARWRKLYLASPSELGAFAHNIAIQVIDSIDHLPATAYSRFPAKTKDIIKSSIIHHTKKQLGTYISPRDPKEAAVFNKYLKRVYQEVDSYVKTHLGVNI